MNNYIVVVGSVSADEYAPVRKSLRSKTIKPKIFRLTKEEWEMRGLMIDTISFVHQRQEFYVNEILRSCYLPLDEGSNLLVPTKVFAGQPLAEEAAAEEVIERYLLTPEGNILALVMHESIWELPVTRTWRNVWPSGTTTFVLRPDGKLEVV